MQNGENFGPYIWVTKAAERALSVTQKVEQCTPKRATAGRFTKRKNLAHENCFSPLLNYREGFKARHGDEGMGCLSWEVMYVTQI